MSRSFVQATINCQQNHDYNELARSGVESVSMSAKEQLLHEIEHAPDSMVEEILDFCLFLKRRRQEDSEQPVVSPRQNGGILDLLKQVEEIQAEVPPEEWDKLPHDGSINHDHYLYGLPKVEE